MIARRCCPDRGAGSAVAIGLIGAVVAVLLVTLPLASVLRAERRAADAADSAALAAADTASGLVAGVPCDTAATVATDDGGTLERCAQSGDEVTVTVGTTALGLPVEVSARAGPPRDSASVGP